MSLNIPWSVESDVVFANQGIGAATLLRRRVVLKSNGCKVPFCTMCDIPGEAALDPVKLENYLNQLKSSLSVTEHVDVLTLYNNGNFFNDAELSPDVRKELAAYIRKTQVRSVVVESLPNFITENKLAETRAHLGEKVQLEVIMGLQTSSDTLRKFAIQSPAMLTHFEKAVRLLTSQGYVAKAFILFGIPFLSKEESELDFMDTLEYLSTQDYSGVVVCPLKPSPKSKMARFPANQQGHYPSMAEVYSMCHTIQHSKYAKMPLFVSTNLLSYAESMKSCEICRAEYVAELVAFNSRKPMKKAHCQCQ